MLKSKYKWNLLSPVLTPDEEIYRVILKNRNIDDPDTFFSMGKEHLHDPSLFQDMEKATSRIKTAINQNQRILIFGDYDCDGVTAISVLYRALRRMNAFVDYTLPDRFLDGYGLNKNAVQKIIRDKYDLVITVDNGITCVEEIALLNQAHIDTIITDHHEVKGELPPAYAIIHAKSSPNYPFKEIAGVMVAYKLASQLLNDPLEEYMDLVMIGTIADLMPLQDENQAMVNLGIKQLRKTTNKGLQKLIEYSNLDIINETAVAFKLAPKINSSGRLGKAMEAVKLLVSDSEKEVQDIILEIEQNHAFRKDLTEEAFLLCEQLIHPDEDVLVVSSPLLHEGIIGICAQKLAEKYQKSTCVITIDEEGIGKGSMRSFGGDNILKMLENNSHLLLKYGGHSQAAGLQLESSNIDKLKEGFLKLSSSQEDMVLDVDMEVDLSQVQVETIKKLQDRSFFTAKFKVSNLTLISKQILTQKHVKLLFDQNGFKIEGLVFNNLEYYYQLEVGDQVDIVCGLSINTWRKRQTMQMMIKDLVCHDIQVIDFRDPLIYEAGKIWIKSSAILLQDEILMNLGRLPVSKTNQRETFFVLPRTRNISLDFIQNREVFSNIFHLIPEQNEISISELEHHHRYDLWTILKVLEIFMELGFVEKNQQGYRKIKTTKKKPLQNSPIYQRLFALKDQIDLIYQLPIQELKKYIINHMEA